MKEVFDNKADDLIDKESDLNKDYSMYKENVDEISVTAKSFDKYIQDTDEIMNRLTIPNIKEYKSWNVDQIVLWIRSLEKGRFNKHIDKLRKGLEISEITGDDLPNLERNDLSSQPFEIGNFKDRNDLVKHFKSLLNRM